MVETEVEAYDAVDNTIDTLTGVWEALQLRINGGAGRDMRSPMLAEVVHAQVESQRKARSWLGGDVEWCGTRKT